MERFDAGIPPEHPYPSNLSINLLNAGAFHDVQNHLGDNISRIPDDINIGLSELWSFATPDNLRQSVAWSIVLAIAYPAVFFIGIIGNILVLLVIILKPPMHPVTNMFLLNLAVADLLVIVFCVPPTLISNLFISWILGSFMCKGVAYVQGVAVCASAYSLAALSLDRLKAVCYPIERHQGLGITKCQAGATISLIWIFGLLITLPWLFVFQVIEEDGQVYCHEAWENEFLGKVYFVVAHLLLCFFVPFLLILSSNIAIWHNLSKRPTSANSVSMRDGVRKTLGFVTAAFLICWLPLYILATCMKFSPTEGMGEWWENAFSISLTIAQWLGSLNSGMNPILYAFINPAFRRGFKTLLSSVIRC